MLTSNKSRRIIVNADDFGMSAEVNRAIVEAFDNNEISSATLMTNMPGFEEACEMAHSRRLLGKIGVHINLTEGYPLSIPIQQCRRFCDTAGRLRSRQTRFWLSKEEMVAAEIEIAAQVKACLDRGVRPTHLDSHHHVHTEWAIGAAAISVAHRYGIMAIRLSRNCGSGINFPYNVYKSLYNDRLRMHGLAKTRYFGSFTDVQEILSTTSGDVEIMVHLNSEYSKEDPDQHGSAGLAQWFRMHQLASYP